MNRKAKNKFEIDFLPPFGVPEVSIFGDAAILATALFFVGKIVKKD